MGDTSNALAAAPALDADAAAAGEVQTDGTGEQDRKLFLGGLSWETTDQKLRDHFGQYGTMTDVVIMTDKVTGRSRGFGFVTFSTKQSAEDALAGSHNIDGKQVEAKRSQSREAMGGGGPAGSDRKIKKVFVGGLAPETTEEEFRECFEKCGPVMETLIMKDGTTGKPRGFGFVTFESEVKLAVPKEQMGPGQRGGRQMGGMRGGPMRGGYDHGGYGGGGYGGGGYGGGGYGGGGYGYGGGYGGGYGPPQGGYGGYGGPPQGGYGGYDYGPPQGGGYGGGYGPPQGGGYGDYGAPPAGGAPAHGGYDQGGYGQPPAQQWQGGGGYGGYEGGGYGQAPAAADGGYGMKGAAPDRYRPY